MSKALVKIVVLILVVAGAAALYFKYKPEQKPAGSQLPELTQILERAQEQAAELALPKAQPFNTLDWQALMKQIADKNDLEIIVKEGNGQQLEISLAEAPVERFVNGFAEMYARGLRVQSIRLLETDQPGWVKADTVKVIVSQ
jgi:16S rRNA U1498 N3-methylase RsmE